MLHENFDPGGTMNRLITAVAVAALAGGAFMASPASGSPHPTYVMVTQQTDSADGPVQFRLQCLLGYTAVSGGLAPVVSGTPAVQLHVRIDYSGPDMGWTNVTGVAQSAASAAWDVTAERPTGTRWNYVPLRYRAWAICGR